MYLLHHTTHIFLSQKQSCHLLLGLHLGLLPAHAFDSSKEHHMIPNSQTEGRKGERAACVRRCGKGSATQTSSVSLVRLQRSLHTTFTHTRTHMHTRTCTRTHTTHTRTRTRTHTHTTHTCKQHTHTQTTHTHTQYTYIHTYVRTYIHTYVDKHAHSLVKQHIVLRTEAQ